MLPEVLEGLAIHAVEDREHAIAEAQAAAERQRVRNAAITDAQGRALHQFYAETLYQQVSAFDRSRAIAAYCDQIEQRIAAADATAPEREAAAAWLAWARDHAAAIDPLQALPTMPAAPSSPPKIWNPTSTASKPLVPAWNGVDLDCHATAIPA